MDDLYDALEKKSAGKIDRAKLGASDLEQFPIDAGVAGTQIAADAAANALIPGSSLALKGARSFGDASQEARRNGATVGQQLAYGTLTAGKDVAIEKVFDGLGGAYGKGLLDKRKALPTVQESVEAWTSTAMQPMLEGIYNGKTIEQNYTSDVWTDALRDAAIKGVASGMINAWTDAQNWALDKTYDTAMQPQTQAALRRKYVGSSMQPSAESYAALTKMLYNKKGNGHRW